jgi:hypothetical protein
MCDNGEFRVLAPIPIGQELYMDYGYHGDGGPDTDEEKTTDDETEASNS